MAFFCRAQGSLDGSAVQGVSEGIVPGNPLTLPGTVESMIPKAVARPAACWTWPVRTKNRVARNDFTGFLLLSYSLIWL